MTRLGESGRPPSSVSSVVGVIAPGGRAGRAKRRFPSVLMWIVLILLAGLVAGPVAMMFAGAFASDALGMPDAEFSLDAITRVYFSTEFLWPLIGTLVLSVSVSLLAVILGAAAAWVLARSDIPLRGLLELTLLVPLFITPFIGTLAWLLLAAPRSGMINVNLRWILGTDVTFVDIVTFPGVLAIMLMYFVPYAYLLVSSALKNMDPSLEEASQMNGRGNLATAFRVTFPIVRPSLAAAFFFIAVIVTGTFTVPVVLGVDMGFTPLAVRVYRSLTVFPSDPPLAAAVGTLIFWFTLGGMYLYRRSLRNANRYVTVGARSTRPRLIKLGWVKIPVIAIFAIYTLFAVVLPYGALVLISLTPYSITDLREMPLSLDNFVEVASSSSMISAITNTVLLGLIVPTLTVALGLAAGYVVNREHGRVAGVVEYLATFPLAVPGIVFATGVLLLYLRTPLYATVAVMSLALIGSYIPHALRFASNGIMQIDRSLEEAARMSGAGKVRTIATITFPLLKPSLLSAWVLLFIFATREVNETVLLASPKSRPLAVLSWNYLESGTLQQAAVAGLMVTAFMLMGVLLARFVLRTKVTSSEL